MGYQSGLIFKYYDDQNNIQESYEYFPRTTSNHASVKDILEDFIEQKIKENRHPVAKYYAFLFPDYTDSKVRMNPEYYGFLDEDVDWPQENNVPYKQQNIVDKRGVVRWKYSEYVGSRSDHQNIHIDPYDD